MLTTKQVLDQIAAEVSPLLKRCGFRKSGRLWRRAANEGIVQVINLQGSVWNADTNGRCTINAGIYVPRLAELLGIGRVTDTPTDADCHLRVRPAMLDDGNDTWREFDTTKPPTIDRAITDLTNTLTQFALPWIATHTTLAEIGRELQRTSEWWWAAACSLALDDREAATNFLSLAIRNASATHAPHLRRWGAEHDLLTDRGGAI